MRARWRTVPLRAQDSSEASTKSGFKMAADFRCDTSAVARWLVDTGATGGHLWVQSTIHQWPRAGAPESNGGQPLRAGGGPWREPHGARPRYRRRADSLRPPGLSKSLNGSLVGFGSMFSSSRMARDRCGRLAPRNARLGWFAHGQSRLRPNFIAGKGQEAHLGPTSPGFRGVSVTLSGYTRRDETGGSNGGIRTCRPTTILPQIQRGRGIG
jgi:hypothetical protein